MKNPTELAYEALVEEVSNFDETSDRSCMLRVVLFHFEDSLPRSQRLLTKKLFEHTARIKKAFKDIIMMGKYPDHTYELPKEAAKTDKIIEEILGRHFDG